MSLNSTVDAVTDRIRERSRASRDAYLDRCRAAAARKPRRGTLSCGNLAHGFAVCGASEKSDLAGTTTADIAIVSSYNDMLSAHQPYRDVSAADQAGGARRGRRRPVRRRRAGDVRRRHPGAGRHGAVAVQPRRDRHGDGGRLVPRHVRRRPDAGHLRQDRAGIADRLPDLRPSADRLRAGRADDHRPAQFREDRASASSTPRASSAATRCWRRNPNPTTAPAPARSTAPRTPTRC